MKRRHRRVQRRAEPFLFAALGALVGAATVLAILYASQRHLVHPRPARQESRLTGKRVERATVARRPDTRPTPRPVPAERRVSPPAPSPVSGPKVAIVLDDWGYSRRRIEMLRAIDQPLTLAILPHTPFARSVAQSAKADGREVILHLPMEAHSHEVASEPATIVTTMSPEEVTRELARALGSVPGAVGVSNHQGSKATESAQVMEPLLRALQSRGLFFFDSLSTSRSVSAQWCREVQVPCAERDVFLDNDDEPAYIQKQLETLIRLARRRGVAIGIGHDRPATLRVLKELLPKYQAEGVQFVKLSELVKP